MDGFAQCFNCRKPIPKGAKRCLHCEADQKDMGELTHDDMQTAAETLGQVMPGALEQLAEMAVGFNTAEDFANAIFVGGCPACDSAEVGSFDEVKGVEDPTVARCFSCGHIWCTECLQPLEKPGTKCGHWVVCEACGEEDECEFMGDPTECPDVEAWIIEQQRGTGMTKKKQEKKVKDNRLFTLDVYLAGGPTTEDFVKKNKVVCRTIKIRGDQTLEDLHEAIFDAFDRDDPHMYEFQVGGKGPMDPKAKRYILPMATEDLFGESESDGTVETPIGDIDLKKDDAFGYWFDFGDDWRHQINVMEIEDRAGRGKYPKITRRIGDSPPQYPDWDEKEE